MRLDCPKCGAKGDWRVTKTPRWRCSPAPGNGGCGYEWDDPNYDDPTIDYKALGYSDKEHYEYITGFDARLREEERARRLRRDEELGRSPPPPPAAPVSVPDPTPNTPFRLSRPIGGNWIYHWFDLSFGFVALFVAFGAITFVIAFIALYFVYLLIGVILGGQIFSMVVLGVVLSVFLLANSGRDGKAWLPFLPFIILAYVLLFVFVVWGSGQDRPPPAPGEDCRIEDRGGRIREVCW